VCRGACLGTLPRRSAGHRPTFAREKAGRGSAGPALDRHELILPPVRRTPDRADIDIARRSLLLTTVSKRRKLAGQVGAAVFTCAAVVAGFVGPRYLAGKLVWALVSGVICLFLFLRPAFRGGRS
jgi:hypothetical protein